VTIAATTRYFGKFTVRVAGLFACLLLVACAPQSDPVPPASDHWLSVDQSGAVHALNDSEDHQCVFDQRTGLMWEVKRMQTGPHRAAATYTWHEPEATRNMSDSGLINGGDCDLDACDIHGLVQTVNSVGLCGYHDWKIPSRQQLLTLGDRRLADTGRIMDQRYFPHDLVGEYWSSETFRLYPQSAWLVSNRHGLDRAELKTEPRYARLVRPHAEPRG